MKKNARYRDQLPQLEDRLFLTDGGIETTLIFHEGVSLPYLLPGLGAGGNDGTHRAVR